LPDFALSAAPASIFLNQGGSANSTISVTPQNGFSGAVALSATGGLPNGVTASLKPASTETTSSLTLKASRMATTGVGTAITITGVSGNLTQSTPPINVSVSAATGTGGSGTPVDLSPAYNLNAFYTDGTTFTPATSLDGEGFAYSANLLTPNRILNGVQFNFGPANEPDGIFTSGQTVLLPAGHFTALQLLATGINGDQTAQPLIVTYTDHSTAQVTQSFSDWFSPSNNTGESEAVAMPYRDEATGGKDNRPFNLYAYTIVLDRTKKVQSLTLPNNRNVVVLAATLTQEHLGTQVDLSSSFNLAGIFDDGVTFPATGGMDGGGDGCTLPDGCADAYSAQQLSLSSTRPPVLPVNGALFSFGPVNARDCRTACINDEINLNPGVTIPLRADQRAAYSILTLLGTGVDGSHTGTITVNYDVGHPDVFNQTFSDWCSFGHNANESVAVGGFSRINSDGTLNTGAACNLYAYAYTLDATRTVRSIQLANTDGTSDTLILAATLTQPRYSLSAGPLTPASISPGDSSVAAVTVTPELGYTGRVTLSCVVFPFVPGQDAPTCDFARGNVSVTGVAASTDLSFTTVAPHADSSHRNGTPAGEYAVIVTAFDGNGVPQTGGPEIVRVIVK
jgi:hypothetical protein